MWNEQNLVCKKEQIKCKNIKKQYIIDYITKEYRKKHNPNGLEIPHHQYREFAIEDSGSGKANSLFDLTN